MIIYLTDKEDFENVSVTVQHLLLMKKGVRIGGSRWAHLLIQVLKEQ